jgi:phosphoribosylamine---glycine ligase
MRILLVGNGAREHAICWKLAQSPRVTQIFTAQGNPGTAHVSKNRNVPISPNDLDALRAFASAEGIDLTFVGPEQPLADGIVDLFAKRNLRIFGPSKEAAKLEASKDFAKTMMIEAGIPTARHQTLTSESHAKAYVSRVDFPIVLKADGLAAGKGVAICASKDEALQFVSRTMTEQVFGSAGRSIVAEEFLEGEEASFLVITDGTNWVPLASAQDHKRLLDEERGPNTGGMGAYSPAPIFTSELQRTTEQKVVKPLLEAMRKRGSPFSGILYVGLMVTREGPKVLEFNARFGDPETQVILPRLESDFAEVLDSASRGRLGATSLSWSKESALTVVLASEGYPNDPRKGAAITGLEKAEKLATVFHAGTQVREGQLVTAGGRIFSVTGLGPTLSEAAARAYAGVEAIDFGGKIFRRDIGWRALRKSS